MKQLSKKIYVGTVDDYREADNSFAFLCCAKHPVFVELGGQGLYKQRGKTLALNMIDVVDPSYFHLEQFEKALAFIKENEKVLVFCNQGRSRSPVIAMLGLIQEGVIKADNLGQAYREMKKLYPRLQANMVIIKFVGSHYDSILAPLLYTK